MKIFEWVHQKFRNGQGLKNSCKGRGAWEEDLTWEEYLKSHKRGEKGYAKEEEEEEEEVKNDLTGLLAIGTLGLQTLPEKEVMEEEENDKDEEARVEELYKQLEEALGLPSSDCSSPMQEKHNVYPLQEFLHSPLADRNPTKARNVKESRTSLGDLFSKSTQKSSPPPPKVPLPTQLPNISPKRGGHLALVKKLLGRQQTEKNSSQADDPAGRHKLVKAIGQFGKKIHPEEMAASCVNAARSRISRSKDKRNFFRLSSCILPCHGDGDEDEDKQCGDMVAVRSHSHCPLSANKQPCSHGHWIKTDTEYVVLEL